MSDIVTNKFFEDQSTGNVDFNNDVFRWILLNYDPVPTNDTLLTYGTYAQVSAHEISAVNGYTHGGIQVGTSAYISSASNEIVYDCDDPVWTATSGSIGPYRFAAMYNETRNGDLVYIYDFLKYYTTYDGGEMRITIDENGLFRGKRSCS